MTKKDFGILNIVFRTVIILAFFIGVRLAINFLRTLANYELMDGDTLFTQIFAMAESYMFFVVLMVVAMVFSILLRKGEKKNGVIIRTVAIGVAMMDAFASFPAIVQMVYIGLAKVPEDLSSIGFQLTLDEVYSMKISGFLIDNPYLFYTYMLSVVIFLGLTITSVISLVKQHKDKKNDNNQYKRY
ncbi:MAG: hypothetical protein Q4F06_06605 [Eubacteriales bacterium]|nr:hypothetical protein [Eubacteriales bacterium]